MFEDNTPLWPIPNENPLHSIFVEEVQYRVKFQTFSKSPSELTVQRVSHQRDVDRYLRAGQNGFTNAFPSPRRGARTARVVPDDESVERSQRRAKTKLRLAVTELAPNQFLTFSTRKVYPLDILAKIWARFVVLAKTVDPDFDYVAVPELHPNGLPGHYHLHVACRLRSSCKNSTRFWHMALESYEGRRVTHILSGVASPGYCKPRNEGLNAKHGYKRARKIAKYISKYVTKELVERFNKKRYWISKGINVLQAQVFWLQSLTQGEAIREACSAFGVWDVVAPAFKAFLPSERVFWMPFDVQHEPPF